MPLILELQGNGSVRIVEKAGACNRAHILAVMCDLRAFAYVRCNFPKIGAKTKCESAVLAITLKRE